MKLWINYNFFCAKENNTCNKNKTNKRKNAQAFNSSIEISQITKKNKKQTEKKYLNVKMKV